MNKILVEALLRKGASQKLKEHYGYEYNRERVFGGRSSTATASGEKNESKEEKKPFDFLFYLHFASRFAFLDFLRIHKL